MKKLYIFILNFILVISYNLSFAQITNDKRIPKKVSKNPIVREKKYTKLSLKTGANISVIFLARNTKDNNNSPGFCAGLTYEANNFVRISTLYTRFRPINIEPTWYDINANTIEANLEILARFPNNKTLFYPFAGFSYNTFKGFFTGQRDYLNLKENYMANSLIKNNWFGLNLGTGIEHNFGILGLFIDYRMRVGKLDGNFNIMDVCYTGGLKIRFPNGKLAKSIQHLDDKFHWF